MKTFLETIGKLIVVILCSIVQLIAVIIGGIGMLFSRLGDLMEDFNYKILDKTGQKITEKVAKT
jgi:hypothetical protein